MLHVMPIVPTHPVIPELLFLKHSENTKNIKCRVHKKPGLTFDIIYSDAALHSLLFSLFAMKDGSNDDFLYMKLTKHSLQIQHKSNWTSKSDIAAVPDAASLIVLTKCAPVSIFGANHHQKEKQNSI